MQRIAIRDVDKKLREAIPELSDCPQCHKHSLFFNKYQKQFDCFKTDCQNHSNPILFGSKLYIEIIKKMQQKGIVKPISIKRLEYEIYYNHVERYYAASEIVFEVNIID